MVHKSEDKDEAIAFGNQLPVPEGKPVQRAFVFIVVVRNPLDDKVKDYKCIEALLVKTVRSLLMQNHPNVRIVVVCHRVPLADVGSQDTRVTYLDVSETDVFPPNTNIVQVDKGLKYIIGALYAQQHLNPDFIMLLDADDYVNVDLNKEVQQAAISSDVDAFLIHQGVHVVLAVDPSYKVNYEQAFVVKQFNASCGSCRVFPAERLIQHVVGIDERIVEHFDEWTVTADGVVAVPRAAARWLFDATSQIGSRAYELVHVLGRHTDQRKTLRVAKLSLIGAAKGCGHGNHDGPRQGAVHTHRVVGELAVNDFCRMFGVAG